MIALLAILGYLICLNLYTKFINIHLLIFQFLICLCLTTFLYFWKYFLSTFLFKTLEKNVGVCLSHSYLLFDALNKSGQVGTSLSALSLRSSAKRLNNNFYWAYADNMKMLGTLCASFYKFKLYCDHEANSPLPMSILWDILIQLLSN